MSGVREGKEHEAREIKRQTETGDREGEDGRDYYHGRREIISL